MSLEDERISIAERIINVLLMQTLYLTLAAACILCLLMPTA